MYMLYMQFEYVEEIIRVTEEGMEWVIEAISEPQFSQRPCILWHDDGRMMFRLDKAIKIKFREVKTDGI